jgi:hypothetical protein
MARFATYLVYDVHGDFRQETRTVDKIIGPCLTKNQVQPKLAKMTESSQIWPGNECVKSCLIKTKLSAQRSYLSTALGGLIPTRYISYVYRYQVHTLCTGLYLTVPKHIGVPYGT